MSERRNLRVKLLIICKFSPTRPLHSVSSHSCQHLSSHVFMHFLVVIPHTEWRRLEYCELITVLLMFVFRVLSVAACPATLERIVSERLTSVKLSPAGTAGSVPTWWPASSVTALALATGAEPARRTLTSAPWRIPATTGPVRTRREIISVTVRRISAARTVNLRTPVGSTM